MDRKINRCLAFFLFGLLVHSEIAQAEDPPPAHAATYRVGLARVCITPDEPIWLAGYVGRKGPSQGELDDLYARALIVEDGDGHRALLVTRHRCAAERMGG